MQYEQWNLVQFTVRIEQLIFNPNCLPPGPPIKIQHQI